MKNQAATTQTGVAQAQTSASSPGGKKEESAETRKRAYFDKEGHLLKRQGHMFRIDHLKLYKIHAALKGVTQQELINNALEYYKVNVLQKSEAQKLKETGQQELEL